MCEKTETQEGDSLERGQSEPSPDNEESPGDQDIQTEPEGGLNEKLCHTKLVKQQ